MSLRQTGFSAITSYVQTVVAILCSLLLVRVATRNLTPEEFGLWSFVFGTIGYFLLLDFGISYSLGRIFADPIYARNFRSLSGQLILAFLVLSLQAGIIIALGLGLRDWILGYFHIGTGLMVEARKLWLWCILIQAGALPFRVFPAILHAQNRVYVVNILSVATSVINILVFWWEVSRGMGVMAYAYASAVVTLVLYSGYIGVAFIGKHGIRLHWVRLPWHELPGIMKYAFAVFASSFAAQASGAAQMMILTKFLGLDAAAVYSVTGRMPVLISSLVLKPFESFRPRWVSQYCRDEMDAFRKEYVFLIRLTILGLCAGFVFSGFANPLFVTLWTRPEFFGGLPLTLAISAASALSGFGLQLNIAFQMKRRMRFFTIVTLLGAVTEIGLSITFVRHIGVLGIPFASLFASGGVVFLFNLFYGSRMVGVPMWQGIRKDLLWWMPPLVVASWGSSRLGLPAGGTLLMSVFWHGIAVMAISAPLVFRACRLLQGRGVFHLRRTVGASS